MKRKGIPEKRIGPAPGCWERSIRKRQFKGAVITLNAAERSILGDGDMSASLCGIKEEKKEKKYEKEVRRGASSVIYLTGRSRERLALSCASVGVSPCTTEACSINDRRFKKEREGQKQMQKEVKLKKENQK